MTKLNCRRLWTQPKKKLKNREVSGTSNINVNLKKGKVSWN
jgi:hypothetical protein